jgi:hypothetical protein
LIYVLWLQTPIFPPLDVVRVTAFIVWKTVS